jgi:putative nucleotidyltransferase with HDIG domain
MSDFDRVLRLVSAMSLMRETHNHHGEQVAALARGLAIAAGLEEPAVYLIEAGAHLHDIGKILVSRTVLNAPRKLSPQEIHEMRQHTTLGWALVESAGFETTICEIVRHHHECYDGNGYPDHLAGESIPLAARIVAICDTYEALTHPRTYRSAFSDRFARTYMETGKNRAFDPRLVDLFFEKVIETL